MRRLVVIALLVMFTSRAVAEESPRYETTLPPPVVFSPLTWKTGDKEVAGYWYTEEQVKRIDVRIRVLESSRDYLTDKAAQECFDKAKEATKQQLLSSSSIWIGVGIGVLVGLVGGVVIGRTIK